MSILSNNFYYQPLKIDSINTKVYGDFVAKEGDANGRGLLVTLTENGLQKDTTGITLNLKWAHTTVLGLQNLDTFESVDLTKGLYKITYPTDMLRKGKVDAFIQIIDSGKLIGSRNIKINVEATVGDDTAIESSNEFRALASALVEVNSWNARIDAVEADFIQRANDVEATYPQELVSLTIHLAKTDQRINNIVTTPVPVGEIIAQEIIDARQGALSVGANITEVKSQLTVTELKNSNRVTRENLFNKSTITTGAIVGNDGVITPFEGFDASDFIYVGDLTEIYLSLTHIVRGFGINKNYVTDFPVMDSMDTDQLVPRPPGVLYLRFSTFNWATPTAQVGVNVDRTQYKSFGKYYADNLVKTNDVLVSKTSSDPEAYSVFCEAVIKNRDIPNTVITVEAGEYDVYSELVGVYGQSFFDNHTEDTTDGWGLEIGNNITIKGSPNAKLRFNYPGGNTSVLGKFALLMLKNSDVKIEGVQLLASNCKYVVHDDWYEKTKPYSHNYKDVKMIMDNSNNPLGNNFRCIGGGVGNEGHVNIDGCIFKAIGSSAEKHLISYHNAAGANAQSRITIVNNYFEDTGSIRLGYYGPSTLLTDVLITSNSYYKDVDVVSEDGITTNNNFNVVKFGNEIRG